MSECRFLHNVTKDRAKTDYDGNQFSMAWYF